MCFRETECWEPCSFMSGRGVGRSPPSRPRGAATPRGAARRQRRDQLLPERAYKFKTGKNVTARSPLGCADVCHATCGVNSRSRTLPFKFFGNGTRRQVTYSHGTAFEYFDKKIDTFRFGNDLQRFPIGLSANGLC